MSVDAQIESVNVLGATTVCLPPEPIDPRRKCGNRLLHPARVVHDPEECGGERYRKTPGQGSAYPEAQLAWKP